jgi:hypothetical protein
MPSARVVDHSVVPTVANSPRLFARCGGAVNDCARQHPRPSEDAIPAASLTPRRRRQVADGDLRTPDLEAATVAPEETQVKVLERVPDTAWAGRDITALAPRCFGFGWRRAGR